MSATANKLKGDWNSIKSKLKLEYGEFTDDDLEFQESQEDELPGRTRKVTRMHQQRGK